MKWHNYTHVIPRYMQMSNNNNFALEVQREDTKEWLHEVTWMNGNTI